MKRLLMTASLLAVPVAGFAAVPPGVVNYQGVLRDASNAPLDGSYEMIFRLWSGENGGDEILVDRHLAVNLQAVTVTGGLFNVGIGTGELLDGSGPGTYTSLASAFRDHGDVWLGIEVGAEALTPRIRIAAAAFALNASSLSGRTAGEFLDTSSTNQTKTGQLTVDSPAPGLYGVAAYGMAAGGYFEDADQSGYAQLGVSDRGIRGLGNQMGGSFQDLDDSGYAFAGYGDTGIAAYGNAVGGYFQDLDNSSIAYAGYGDYGVQAFGTTAGGYLKDLDGTGYAYLGYGETGVRGIGHNAGGYFQNSFDSSYSFLGHNNYGIESAGNNGGGRLEDLNGSYAYVAFGTYKIYGTGTVSFVQNHPAQQDRVIVYAAPEGDEVAVYTRGSAKLEDGEARVELGQTFALVTNPDLGLTAHATPRGEVVALAVDSVTPSVLVVRGPAGSSVEFDYIVYGLRLGFEELPIVQVKQEEAFLPLDETIAEFQAGQPDVIASSAMARFQKRNVKSKGEEQDLSRSRTLAARVNEGRDAWRAARVEKRAREAATPLDSPRADAPLATVLPSTTRPPALADPPRFVAPQEVSEDGPRMVVTEPVEEGDLLALDPSQPGVLHRAATMADPYVIGIAAGPSRADHEGRLVAPLAGSRYAPVKVDAGYGAILPGDLLVASPTPGHAMRARETIPGTILGKAIDPQETGTGRIRVLLLER